MSTTADTAASSVRLQARWLGLVPYDEALNLQQQLQADVIDRGGDPGYLLLLEHPPVITAGRSGGLDELRASPAELARLGVELRKSRRGGRLTYHGPGQLVGYPVLNLKVFRLDVHWYLRQLEEVVIRVLHRLEVQGERRSGHTGVWVGGRKIASIGVAIRRWVTAHGFALNVSPDMSHFRLLHPCGLSPEAMTSLAELLGEVPTLSELAHTVAVTFARVFGLPPEQAAFAECGAGALCHVGVP